MNILDELERVTATAKLADPIAELNKTYAVIRVVNRAAILNEHLDAEGRPTFSLLSPDGFKLLLANRTADIPGTDKDGNDVMIKVPLAPYWIKHRQRRQHEGIAFSPQGAPPGYFNLWNGFAVQPNQVGSCELFKQHLLDNVCDGNGALFNWVFGWFTDIFQKSRHQVRHLARPARRNGRGQNHRRRDLRTAPRIALCPGRRSPICQRTLQC